MQQNNQRGISLITVFFIMTIVLSVVLSLSVTLFNELKNISSSENSLVAFYLADSGVEKLLYFDRKQIPAVPPGTNNGICNIDNVCTDCERPVQEIGEDCVFCKSCEVSYITRLDGENRYETTARVSPNGSFFNIEISVKGFYKDTSRAIGLQIANKDLSSSAPNIGVPSASRDVNGVTISVTVTDPDGVDGNAVIAHIRDSTDPSVEDVAIVPLHRQLASDGSPTDTFSTSWAGQEGYLYVYVRACDVVNLSKPFANCGESIRVPITGP